MALSQQQSKIYKYFGTRPIAYQPSLGIVFDSPSVGIFLSQLLYWQGKERLRDGWMYKTIPDLEQETGLSRNQQDTAIKICKAAGFLEVKLTGRVPRTRHFRLDVLCLEIVLTDLLDNHGIMYLKPPRQSAVNQQTNTESTQKITSNNTGDYQNYRNKLSRSKGF